MRYFPNYLQYQYANPDCEVRHSLRAIGGESDRHDVRLASGFGVHLRRVNTKASGGSTTSGDAAPPFPGEGRIGGMGGMMMGSMGGMMGGEGRRQSASRVGRTRVADETDDDLLDALEEELANCRR